MLRIALIAGLALMMIAVPASALDAGETVLLTQATNGTNASGHEIVNLSQDGRCAVFASSDAALPQANGFSQIYLRDTEANTTTLVSQGAGGAAGDADSRGPVTTPDCRYVAWDSVATNLLATAQSERLVYRRDLQTGTNVLISRADGPSGVVPVGGAFVPRMSDDGNEIAFTTRAKNLSSEDSDGNLHTDVFVRVVSSNQTELVSRTSALRERGVSHNAAILAAQAGVTVFHVAFARWVEQDDPTAFRRLMDESLEELRSVTAAY